MESSTLIQLLPEFARWSRLEKNSEQATAQKQIYLIRRILLTYLLFCEENCKDYILLLKDSRTASTIEKWIHALRVFCDFLVSRGILDINWARTIPIPKREVPIPTILSVKEIETILNCHLGRTYGHYPNPQEAEETFNIVFSLLAKTGSRLGEVLGIKIGDINWEESVWTLQHTKTDRGRLIPLPPDLMPKMNKLIGNRTPTETLFLNPLTSKPMRHHQIENNFRLRLKVGGIKKNATVHTLRHSFITELLRQDISVLKIANIVGHENIKTTQDYARLLYEDLRDAILRHPLTLKYRNPYDILSQIKETISKFHLKEDSRFMYNLEEGNEGIRISIFIRMILFLLLSPVLLDYLF